MKKMNSKQWMKIVGYMIPIIALVVANLLNLNDPTEIETALTGLATAILGVIGAVGIVANNDKEDDKNI